MFATLSEKLRNLFSGLAGKKTLSEENISEAVKQVRLALLDADVNYGVVSQFVKRVKEKAVGEEVLKAVSPGQQFIKIVHDALVELMGSEEAPLDLKGKHSVLMLCGLQGSGKTTTAAKLATYIQKTEVHKRILLVACDLQRPAAVDQLKKLGEAISIPVFFVEGEKDPLRVAKKALEKAQAESFDVLIVDTAGRLHLDEELMHQLEQLKALLTPREILFVAHAATGQEAVRIAAEFNKRIEITGTILTMLDGNARAGAAISIREVTQKPLKFEGIGEKIDDLQLFHPRSMADRILGMGDVINLVRRAQEHFDEEEEEKLAQKLRKATFSYEDFLQQMRKIRKMGSLKSLFKMLPGFSSMGDFEFSEEELNQTEAMILSMTPREREERDELTISRRKRVARGSGVALEKVHGMAKNFKRAKQLFKNMPDFQGKMKEGMKKWH